MEALSEMRDAAQSCMAIYARLATDFNAKNPHLVGSELHQQGVRSKAEVMRNVSYFKLHGGETLISRSPALFSPKVSPADRLQSFNTPALPGM